MGIGNVGEGSRRGPPCAHRRGLVSHLWRPWSKSALVNGRGGWGRAGAMLVSLTLLGGCTPAREVVLRELVNDQIDRTRIGLHHIEPRQIFRRGKRVTVDFASVLVLDAASKTIKTEVVSAGDEIWIGGQRWIVLRVEPRTPEARGQIVLTPAED